MSMARTEHGMVSNWIQTYDKHFIIQLFVTAVMMKKVWEGQHSDTVVLLTYSLTNIIQDQVKEGKLFGLDCQRFVPHYVQQNNSVICIMKTKACTCNLLSCLLILFSISIG